MIHNTLVNKAKIQKDIIDIKPPQELHIDYIFWLIVIGIVLIIILAIAGRILWRRRKKMQKTIPKLPPHEAALAKLHKLKRMKCTSAQEIKKLYFKLSEVFRLYMEERYRFPATEWTSEEIIHYIKKSMNADLQEQSVCFLCNTDLVKFAQHIPQEEKIKDEINRAIAFIEATKEELNAL